MNVAYFSSFQKKLKESIHLSGLSRKFLLLRSLLSALVFARFPISRESSFLKKNRAESLDNFSWVGSTVLTVFLKDSPVKAFSDQRFRI